MELNRYREPEEYIEDKSEENPEEKLEERPEDRPEDKQIEEDGKIKKNQRRRKRRPAAHRFELQGISSAQPVSDRVKIFQKEEILKTEITISEQVQIRKARSVKEIATKFHSQPIAIVEEADLEPHVEKESFEKNKKLRESTLDVRLGMTNNKYEDTSQIKVPVTPNPNPSFKEEGTPVLQDVNDVLNLAKNLDKLNFSTDWNSSLKRRQAVVQAPGITLNVTQSKPINSNA